MLSSREITLDFFSDKTRSIAKDFYIWRFLDQNISAKKAEALIGEVNIMSSKLFFKFADKLDIEGFKEIADCLKAKPKELINASADCIALGLTPDKATKLTKDELITVADKVREKYPNRVKIYEILASNNPFNALIKANPI
jgi:soluble lytic murein transglycosylase